ncbi:MAG: type II toxin-antitoxin system RelE family toxin [Dehalococcoidia bacterium]
MEQIEWSDQAIQQLIDLAAQSRPQAARVHRALREHTQTGRGDVKKLEGALAGQWRLRAGDWRVSFRRLDGGRISVVSILNRRDAYDD